MYCQSSWNRNFKGVSLDLAGDRADQSQTALAVVGCRGQHQSRTAASLLMTGLRIKHQPDKITSFRDIWGFDYHTSLPTASPLEISWWVFSGVIFASSISRVGSSS